jgi:acyl carrier protein
MKNVEQILVSIASSASHKDVSSLDINIIDDLNMDSLDAIGFLFEVENNLDVKVPEEHIDEFDLFNLKNLHDYISKKLASND